MLERGFAVSLVAVLFLGGCLHPANVPSNDAPDPAVPAPIGGLVPFTVSSRSGSLSGRAAAGDIGAFQFSPSSGAGSVRVQIPTNVFRFEDRAFSASHAFMVEPGTEFHLLVPPGMTNLTLMVNDSPFTVPTPRVGHGLFHTQDIIDWFKVQRDRFPGRCNGCPSYLASQPYFADLFRSFGMATVEVDPYGMNPVHANFANIVAYKYSKLDAQHPLWIGMGGHYDAVTGTVEAAFDDTSGSLVTLELAKVFANISTVHNMVFGLWGGEESGLQGSAFFTKTNPNIAAQMSLYVNHDADAFSWPGPAPAAKDGSSPDCSKPSVKTRGAGEPFYCPDPVLVTAGPDGPVADRLLALTRAIQEGIVVGYPSSYFLYEPVGQGQVSGYARINAQSDHTSFIAAGVPSVFLINANIETTRVGYHNKADTFANYTKYMVRNQYVDMEEELTPEEQLVGEGLMMDAFDTYLWLTFYMVLLADLGVWNVATG